MEQQKHTKSKSTIEQPHDDSSTVCTLFDDDSSVDEFPNGRERLRRRFSTDLREDLFQSSELEDLDDIRLSSPQKRWRDDDAQEGKDGGVGSVADFLQASLQARVNTFTRNIVYLSKVSSRSLQMHNAIVISGGSLAVPSDRKHQPRFF